MVTTVPTLAVCCVCKQVAEGVSPSSRWISMSAYLDRHHLQSVDVRLSHTYCPACYDGQARAWSLPRKSRTGRTARIVR
jgi:predicted AAA+ superfamily ATPase